MWDSADWDLLIGVRAKLSSREVGPGGPRSGVLSVAPVRGSSSPIRNKRSEEAVDAHPPPVPSTSEEPPDMPAIPAVTAPAFTPRLCSGVVGECALEGGSACCGT